MTPLKVKSVVDAAVVGGVTYQGTFDASSPADLSNASKGDLYIISVAGSYQGQDWAVGDHLLINADMGGTLDPAKIDKVDNTDSVTSVAGRTGAVVLSAGDVSGLATVATSGAYSDLSGTPTLATVATTGAYSDLSGTPTLGTAAAEDVGTSANNVVQLNGSAQLPAVDGSLLTNISATVAALDDIGDVDTTGVSTNNVLKYDGANWVDGSVAYSEVSGTPALATIATTGDYSDLNDSVVVQQFNATATASAISSNALHVFRLYGAGGFSLTLAIATVANGFALFHNISGSDVTVSGTTFRSNGEGVSGGSSSITVKAGERRLYYLESIGVYVESNSTLIGRNGDVTITSPSNGEALIYNSTSGDWENGTVSASVAALDDIGDVDTTGVSTNNVLKYDGANWVDGSVAYSEVSGTPTLATIATTGDYSDLNDSVVVQQFNATATASAISSNALHVFRLYGAGGFSLTLAIATVANGFALFHNISGSDVTVSGTTFRSNGEGVSGGSSSITVKAGERRLYYLESIGVYVESNSTLIGRNGDVTITSPSNGEALIYNSTSGDWENGTVSASVAALDDIGDVDTTGVSTNNVLKYDGANWVDGSVAYSEVTGTPTLATVATTGAYSDLSGTPSLATVATTGAYSDLSGLPTLGTAAALDVGTSATNVVQLDGSARLPAVDGSQLTNLPGGGGSAPSVTVSSPSTDQTLSAPSGIEEVYIYTPSAAISVNLVAAATCGSGFKYQIKNRSTDAITIDPSGSETVDGSATFGLNTQEASVTLITDGSNWFII
jgi:hypothetical protein